jgi:hypothetical protein
LRRLALITLALTLTVIGLFHRYLIQNNFDVVDPGRVYRSAQPKGDLGRVLADNRIASVLNLRGGSESDWWYANEVRETRKRDFYDLPLSAARRPTRRELLVLLDLFDRCSYPLLIHCKSGSDRTGLAVGLYLMAKKNVPPEKALRAFSIWHGHVPIYGPETLHEPFVEYQTWLAANQWSHSPGRFRDWVQHHYRANDTAIDVAPLQPGPRAEVLLHARYAKSGDRDSAVVK